MAKRKRRLLKNRLERIGLSELGLRCHKCDIVRPLDCFYSRNKGKNLSGVCKACTSERLHKVYMLTKRTNYLKYQSILKASRKRQIDRCNKFEALYGVRYNKPQSEHLQALHKKWYTENREERLIAMREKRHRLRDVIFRKTQGFAARGMINYAQLVSLREKLLTYAKFRQVFTKWRDSGYSYKYTILMKYHKGDRGEPSAYKFKNVVKLPRNFNGNCDKLTSGNAFSDTSSTAGC